MKNLLNLKLIFVLLMIGLNACDYNREQPAPRNQTPIVNAGEDFEIFLPVNTISLSGRAEDADGTIVNTFWKQKSGPSQAILKTVEPQKVIVSSLKEGAYVFEFQATDDQGNSTKDEIQVKVSLYVDANFTLRLRQITYSETDYELFERDQQDRLIRYTSQYQNTQGTPLAISTWVYDLIYDEAGLLAEIKVNQVLTYKYFYDNDRVLSKTQQLAPNGLVLETKYYTFDKGYLTEEIRETTGLANEKIQIKVVYEYDQEANLNKQIFYQKKQNEPEYSLLSTLTYSDFDGKRKADNIKMAFPFIPDHRFQQSNPRKIEHRIANDTLIASEKYTYEYRNHDLPSKVTREDMLNPQPSLSAVYMY